MKKVRFYSLLALLPISTITYAQVGINTPTPTSTLDVTAKNATGTTTNVDGLLVPRVDRQRAQSMTGVPTSTLIYVNNVATGAQSGIAANVDTVGYYYYNGTLWTKFTGGSGTGSNINIYNADGTLTGNRLVSQLGSTLAFTGTATNAFSVDNNSLSVDAANHRVGIGTTSPANKLVVKGVNSQPSNTSAILRVDGDSNHALDFGVLANSPYGSYISSKDKNSGGGLPLALNASGGNVGIGTLAPSNKLHVNATDPLRLEGISEGVTSTDRLLVIDPTGVVKSIKTLGGLSIPNPAVFRLENSQNDFLSSANAGISQVVPMSVVKNTIPGLSYDAGSSTITFPAGTYEIMFVYEGTHNAANCTLSSYFVDFPLNNNLQRIHSTAGHNQGGQSNHGGAITYATAVPANRTWQIRLGRGVSGNCGGAGMLLRENSTQLLVFRVGD